MSVDLVGSTAFKAKHADTRIETEPYPIWLNITKSFYRRFPEMLSNNYDSYLPQFRNCSDYFKDRPPQVWKTVGDEIIFCIGLVCLEHLAVCARAFVTTLAEYGLELQADQKELDVKGSAWLASFPAPNATIISASQVSTAKAISVVGDNLGEDEEQQADVQPGKYDFLGKSVDTGFRISRFAHASELALSIELAWLLLFLKQLGHADFQFLFRGKEILKGVINHAPYPIVTIETERSVKKKELSALERNVLLTNFAEPIALRNYLRSFMEQHLIDAPVISLYSERSEDIIYPQCFLDFRDAWNRRVEEDSRRVANAEAAEDQVENGNPENENSYSLVKNFAEELIRQLRKNYPRNPGENT